MHQFKFECGACFDGAHLMSDTSVPIYLTFFKDQFPLMTVWLPMWWGNKKTVTPTILWNVFHHCTVACILYHIPDDLQSVYLGNITAITVTE